MKDIFKASMFLIDSVHTFSWPLHEKMIEKKVRELRNVERKKCFLKFDFTHTHAVEFSLELGHCFFFARVIGLFSFSGSVVNFTKVASPDRQTRLCYARLVNLHLTFKSFNF